MRKVADAMKGDIEARRTDPRDDLFSLLWRSEIDGKPMTFERWRISPSCCSLPAWIP